MTDKQAKTNSLLMKPGIGLTITEQPHPQPMARRPKSHVVEVAIAWQCCPPQWSACLVVRVIDLYAIVDVRGVTRASVCIIKIRTGTVVTSWV